MSKKMWHKIFKSKAQKQQQQQQQLNKINKRHSRGIYEEYQQLTELLNGEKAPASRFSNENENENSYGNSSSSNSGNINVFEQQPQQSSFNSTAFSEAQQQPLQQHQEQQQQQQRQQQQQLSTFSRVRNTFSLRRNNNSNSSKKQTPNAKSSESVTPTPTPTAVGAGQLQHVLIIVNQIDVATAAASTAATSTTTTNSATNSVKPVHAPTTTTTTTINSTTMESDGAEEDAPVDPPPGPLTTGFSEAIIQQEVAVTTDLTPCPNCSRTFNTNALRKHIVICEKMSKKRKVFDSSRQRREGTSLSTYVLPKNFGLPNAEKAPGVHTPPPASREASTVSSGSLPQDDSPLPTRRKGRADVRAPLRKGGGALAAGSGAAEPAAAAAATVAAAAPPAMSRDRTRASDRSISRRIKESASERCPHCDRSFNTKAYDRHVEWCKEKAIQANIKGNNTVETSKAKERMEARKQYRPPNLKTKRSINRDKYSGAQEEQYEPEMVSPKPNQMSLSAMTSSVQSDNPQRSLSHRPSTPEAHQERAQLLLRRSHPNICQDMDESMKAMRRTDTSDGLQVAKLDCVEAAPLQPVRSRRAQNHRPKAESTEFIAGPPQVTMTFEELNGLIKRQGGANICNIKMEIEKQEIKVVPKERSSTSLVRQARRRIRTHENPNIDLRSLQDEESRSDIDVATMDQDGQPANSSQVKRIALLEVFSGSETEIGSHCSEPRQKLQPNTQIQVLSRPKKRTQLPAIMSKAEPLRALPMQELKRKGGNFLPPLDLGKEQEHDSEYDQEDQEVLGLLDGDKQLAEVICSDVDQAESPLPITARRSSSAARRRDTSDRKEEPSKVKGRERSPLGPEHLLVNSGLSPLVSDKYDPFLSAKRQLEELCSPSTPPDNEPLVTPSSVMSTSLTSTLGKAAHTTTATATTTTMPKPATTSNFRRTSSLRGPRRTPLLPSRPLFATNYRPTIQRGLSDEGPISSNFLKPEEFDEMPVRAACGNDFHSPRVVRRDTSASNRKQQLKLPLGGATEPDCSTAAVPSKQAPARNVAKTDSLAVFLKYEHELEQLNAKAAEVVAASSKELSSKELKDKSNNLSKQNSAKNLTVNPNAGQLPPLTTPICPPVAKENIENVAHNFATPLRLEPICKQTNSLTSPNNNNNINCSNNNNNNSNSNGGNLTPLPIKLETIFGSSRLGDYIDPKLINPCDNLHVQQSSTGSSEASSTPQQLSQSRSSSQSTITMAPEQRRHSGEARNLLKRKMRLGRNQFLYDASPEEAYISSGSCADDEANRSSLEFDEQCWQQQQKQLLSTPLIGMPPLTMPNMPVLPTFDDFDFEEFLSSFENENDEEQFPLFRDCREFLLNRTTSRQRSFQKATSTPQAQTQSPAPTQTLTATKPTPTATQRPATTGTSSQFITPPKAHYYNPPARRSNSNMSFSSDSTKSGQQSCGYKTPNGSGSFKSPINSSYKTASSGSEDKFQRQQSNLSGISSHAEKDESQRREIFISIETEPNAQGRSPISPDSLRHMVGNAQTHIDVLHIENGNEPEHAKFSKISDNEEHLDAELADETNCAHYKKRLSSTASTAAKPASPSPNVEANNAKNVIEKMRSDFEQLGEEVVASVRRDVKQRQELVQQKQQQAVKAVTPLPSGDSDELSSLDGYPMSSSLSSRQGASSKLSSDSAYGSSNSPYSLSRQRSSELQSDTNITRSRPHTASGALASAGKPGGHMMDASTQAHHNYGTLKARQLLFPGNGLGGGDGPEVQPQPHSQLQQQKSQPQVAYDNNNYELNAVNFKNNNNNNNNNNISSNNNNGVGLTPTTSQQSLHSSNSNASSSMSSSLKMSKFCHECGTKFVIEHAKFCMDCGVRRVVL